MSVESVKKSSLPHNFNTFYSSDNKSVSISPNSLKNIRIKSKENMHIYLDPLQPYDDLEANDI